jgi:hypothetical protein
MLHLEALLCLSALMVLLSLFLSQSTAFLETGRSSLDRFQAELAAENYAFLVDAAYNNAVSHALQPDFPCQKKEEEIVCFSERHQAMARLENEPEILTARSRLRGNEHYS